MVPKLHLLLSEARLYAAGCTTCASTQQFKVTVEKSLAVSLHSSFNYQQL